jgi:hypothetical protein
MEKQILVYELKRDDLFVMHSFYSESLVLVVFHQKLSLTFDCTIVFELHVWENKLCESSFLLVVIEQASPLLLIFFDIVYLIDKWLTSFTNEVRTWNIIKLKWDHLKANTCVLRVIQDLSRIFALGNELMTGYSRWEVSFLEPYKRPSLVILD